MPFTYQWEHDGQVCKIEERPDGTWFYVDRLHMWPLLHPPIALEFKHLVEENKRLQEGK